MDKKIWDMFDVMPLDIKIIIRAYFIFNKIRDTVKRYGNYNERFVILEYNNKTNLFEINIENCLAYSNNNLNNFILSMIRLCSECKDQTEFQPNYKTLLLIFGMNDFGFDFATRCMVYDQYFGYKNLFLKLNKDLNCNYNVVKIKLNNTLYSVNSNFYDICVFFIKYVPFDFAVCRSYYENDTIIINLTQFY